jgi:hypothetical protein
MNQKLMCFCALTVASCAVSTASAQERGAVGVTMGYPSSVGLIWHVAERLALRPEVSLAKSGTETPGTRLNGSGSASTVGVGISALLYVGKWDALRTYVAPRFVYSRRSGRTEVSGESLSLTPSGVTTTITQTITESTTTSKSAMGLFGATYSLHPHFSVFGEVGFG